jgi:hypothetical protein
MTTVQDGILGGSGLEKTRRRRWTKDRPFGRVGKGAIMLVELSFLAQVFLVFVIIIILALGAFVVIFQVIVALG